MSEFGAPRRVALVDGCRTPFAKARRELRHLTPLQLATAVAGELARRNGLDGAGADRVGALHLGTALSYPRYSFLAREAALDLGWTATAASDAEYACASSLRCAVDAVYGVALGEHDVAIAGGLESMSHVPIDVTDGLRHHLVSSLKAGPADRSVMERELRLADLLPDPPQLTEPYSGVSLAAYAERLAEQWDVERAAADELTARSHHRAAAARAAGHLDGQVVPVTVAGGGVLDADPIVDGGLTVEALAARPALFPAERGVVTAAGASPVTDGSGAVLLASEDECARRGWRPLAWVRSWAFTSHAPDDGVLLGPAFSLPRALDRAGITLDDVGLVDIHEAFAGQVLANLAALASDEFAKRHLDRDTAVGTVEEDRLNVWGGTLAYGHPFGATGARLLTQLARAMDACGVRYGATALCVGGSRGAAVVLERAA